VIFAGFSEANQSRPWAGALLVLADSGIKGAKDLEGRKLAVGSLRGLDRVTISEWMTRKGADPNKVVWQEVPYGNMSVALRTKQVDIMITADPFLTVEEDQGGVRNIAFVYPEIDPKMPVGGWITTESWLKKGDNRQLIDRFLRGFRKGLRYLEIHPEKRGEILTKYTRIKPELASRLRYWASWNLKIDRPALQQSADLALKWGLITKKLDVREIVLPEALR
jgi:NitT/TauT family transport system substrate-binding protein